jgi:hypothetical protein
MKQNNVVVEQAILTPSLLNQIRILQEQDCEAIRAHRNAAMDIIKFISLDVQIGGLKGMRTFAP